MIETLNMVLEKVNFKNESQIKFYDNTECKCYPIHCHAPIEIIMPVDFAYTVICNSITYQLRQGDILIIQPNVPHQMPASYGRRFICQASLQLIYPHKLYDSICALFPSTLLITPEKDQELYSKVRELIYAIYSEYQNCSNTAELSMYVCILQILSLISKANLKNNAPEEDVKQKRQMQTSDFPSICEYINHHYMEKLTLEEIAKMNGFSRFHFDRLFKKQTNETFYQYLNKIRIQNAVALLTDDTFSITEIAYKSGFTTISSFIRMFRIHHNCTPSEFRSKCQKEEFGELCAN